MLAGSRTPETAPVRREEQRPLYAELETADSVKCGEWRLAGVALSKRGVLHGGRAQSYLGVSSALQSRLHPAAVSPQPKQARQWSTVTQLPGGPVGFRLKSPCRKTREGGVQGLVAASRTPARRLSPGCQCGKRWRSALVLRRQCSLFVLIFSYLFVGCK